jgi:energy-coupling factor transporter ATP-binding protein EcfA2
VSVITDVRVEGFRSLRRGLVSELGDYVPIIGMNGTGKSNLLRALNLFFNETIDDDGRGLDLSGDFTDHLKGKKREVSVEVTFDVASGLLPKGTPDFVTSYQDSGSLRIRRHWSLLTGTKQLVEDVYAEEQLLESGGQERAAALALIRSVTFRYVSNHVRPSDIIRDNVRTLRPTLVKRAKQTSAFGKTNVDAAMTEMAKVAAKMFSDVSTRVAAGAREIAEVAADMPDDFAELAFDLALRTISSAGVPQLVDRQGSGSQSFILMHLLDLLDSAARERGYGWVQQHIWAVEEPESFLHAALRSRFAHDLREHASHERRQIIVTTHQDEFIRIGDYAWTAKLDGGSTTFTRDSAQDAVLEASRLRVTSFQHPLLTWAEVPLVIVEGYSDAQYLRAAALEVGLRPRWRLITMDDLEPSLGGGSGVVAYLRQNPSLLAARPESAPILVVKDWEVSEKEVNDAKKAAQPHATSTAIRLPEYLANPRLGRKFRGIERMLPTDIVTKMIADNDLIPASKASEFPIGVDKGVLESKKQVLLAAALAADSVGRYMIETVRWIDSQVDVALGKAPPELFL